MIWVFDAVGLYQWFRYFAGVVGFTAAAEFFAPYLQIDGAALVAATMVGAVIAHVFESGLSSVPALLILVLSTVIDFAFRGQALGPVG